MGIDHNQLQIQQHHLHYQAQMQLQQQQQEALEHQRNYKHQQKTRSMAAKERILAVSGEDSAFLGGESKAFFRGGIGAAGSEGGGVVDDGESAASAETAHNMIASRIPKGWVQVIDPMANHPYFLHRETGTVTTTFPSMSMPTIGVGEFYNKKITHVEQLYSPSIINNGAVIKMEQVVEPISNQAPSIAASTSTSTTASAGATSTSPQLLPQPKPQSNQATEKQ